MSNAYYGESYSWLAGMPAAIKKEAPTLYVEASYTLLGYPDSNQE